MRTLLRAAVMLAVLVAAPILWIYRGPLPGPAQQAVDEALAGVRDWWTARPLPASHEQTAAPLQEAVAKAMAPVDAVAFSTPASPSTPDDELARRMEPLLVQLRRQGASEYALESWGLAGQLFRFTCLLPMANNPDHVQQFEAIAEDPSEAVEQVLREASQWRLVRSSQLLRR